MIYNNLKISYPTRDLNLRYVNYETYYLTPRPSKRIRLEDCKGNTFIFLHSNMTDISVLRTFGKSQNADISVRRAQRVNQFNCFVSAYNYQERITTAVSDHEI